MFVKFLKLAPNPAKTTQPLPITWRSERWDFAAVTCWACEQSDDAVHTPIPSFTLATTVRRSTEGRQLSQRELVHEPSVLQQRTTHATPLDVEGAPDTTVFFLARTPGFSAIPWPDGNPQLTMEFVSWPPTDVSTCFVTHIYTEYLWTYPCLYLHCGSWSRLDFPAYTVCIAGCTCERILTDVHSHMRVLVRSSVCSCVCTCVCTCPAVTDPILALKSIQDQIVWG